MQKFSKNEKELAREVVRVVQRSLFFQAEEPILETEQLTAMEEAGDGRREPCQSHPGASDPRGNVKESTRSWIVREGRSSGAYDKSQEAEGWWARAQQ